MRGRNLAIFLTLILVTMFLCKTFLPIDNDISTTTAAAERQSIAN